MAQTTGRVISGKLKNSCFYVNWQQASQSTSNNSTTINWQAGLNTGGATSNYDYWYSNAVKINSLWINGNNVCSGTYSNIGMDKGKDYQLASGSITIPHNTDGTKTFNITINGWLYSYGDTSGANNFELTSIPRYANITSFSVSKRDETSLQINYTSDANLDYAWYSLDNGSNWYPLPISNIISGLSHGTTYNVKIRVRRSDSQLTTDSGNYAQSTYYYPHCIDTPNFVIGDPVTLTLYNPLGRPVDIKGIAKSNGASIFVAGNFTGIHAIGFNDSGSTNTQYNSIPNATNGAYKVEVKYGNSTITRDTGNTYWIKGTETPSFNNFTYKDTNTTVTEVTGNNQVLVKGLSNLEVTISSANKMVANYGANSSKYIATIDTLNKSVNYSTSDINLTVGTIINSGTKRLNVTAYDSRNLSKTVYKDITVYDYNKPVINGSITRLNNFEAETTLKINGTYTRLNIGGTDKNTISSIQYRYRETGGTWGNWTNLTTTVTSGKYTCNDVILSLDNTKSFEFEIKATDKLGTISLTRKLDIGQAVFFISSNKKQCYINGKDVLSDSNVYPVAKSYNENTTFEDVTEGKAFYRSGLYTGNISNTWYHLINVRHRNGITDGIYYGIQLRKAFNQNAKLEMRTQNGGTWYSWENLYRGKILYDNYSGSKGTITLNETINNFEFIDILFRTEYNNDWKITRIRGASDVSVTLEYTEASISTSAPIYIFNRRILLQGTTISTYNDQYGYTDINGSTKNVRENRIFISKVIGYR